MPRRATRRAAGGSDDGATAALDSLVAALFAAPDARRHLQTRTPAERRALARLARLEAASAAARNSHMTPRQASRGGPSLHRWVACDQSIPSNVADLCGALVEELVAPYRFYRGSLRAAAPRAAFERRSATPPLRRRDGYWKAPSGQAAHAWLPPAANTLDAVCHFVQAGSGTGVHVGNGLILTCAHCVAARDDDEDSVPARVGRRQACMFPDGRTFLCECVAAVETSDGADVAVAALGEEVAAGEAAAETLPPAAAVLAGVDVPRRASSRDKRTHTARTTGGGRRPRARGPALLRGQPEQRGAARQSLGRRAL